MARPNGNRLNSSSEETIAIIDLEGRKPSTFSSSDCPGDDIHSLEREKEQNAVDPVRLGRQRPEVFSSTWTEVAFVLSVLMSLAMADFFIGGFQVILPAMVEPLDIPTVSQTWPSSVITLVLGAFLLPMGRLADMYGAFYVFSGGLIWYVLWAVIAGFSRNFIMLVVCRAMEGLGAAAILPAGVCILGRTYSPGPRKNLVYGLYGCVGPFGYFLGTVVGGLAVKLLTWRWYFWAGAIMLTLSCIGVILTGPRDYKQAREMNVKMDWLGTCTIIPGLMLLVYAITDSSRQPKGWLAPQILTCVIIGILLLVGAVYIEGWVATAPLIPPEMFRVKYMKRIILCLLLSWGSFSILIFYANFYIQRVIGQSPLTTALWFSPRAAGGFFLAFFSGFILHRVPGQVLLIISAMCVVLSMLLFSLMPEHPLYWTWVFPAMLGETFFVNVNWTVINMFFTTNLPKDRQGLAGALGNVNLYVGNAFFLAIANVVLTKLQTKMPTLKQQYQSLFMIALGLGCLALFVCFFIGIKPTKDGNLPDDTARAAGDETDSEQTLRASSDLDEAKEPIVSIKEMRRAVIRSPSDSESDADTIYERWDEAAGVPGSKGIRKLEPHAI